MAQLLPTTSLTAKGVFTKKQIFLDNDFLSVVFNDADALQDLVDLTAEGYLIIEPLIKFEFLQSVFLPAQRKLKGEFIGNDEIFLPAMEHQSIFSAIMKNAFTLSNVYAHGKCTGVSFIDFYLASRATYTPNSFIITGNRKHFPRFLFDTVGILNYEEDISVRAYSVIQFNPEKYASAVARWENL